MSAVAPAHGLLAACGPAHSPVLESHLAAGGLAGLRRAAGMSPQEIILTLRAAGLRRGRGSFGPVFQDWWRLTQVDESPVLLVDFRCPDPLDQAPAALLSGDVDFIEPVPPQDMKRLADDPNIELVSMPGTRVITLQLNQKRREEFKNPKVREAIIYAINNPGIVKTIMKGDAMAAGQQSPKGYAGYNPDLTPRFDLEKAKQLMKEAGYEKGFEVTMIAPNNRYVNDEKIAEAVVGMLSKIGIKVNLKTMPKDQY